MKKNMAGAMNPLLIQTNLVSQQGPIKLIHSPIRMSEVILPNGGNPGMDNYFEYVGSNTFSPCETNVKRIVYETPLRTHEDLVRTI